MERRPVKVVRLIARLNIGGPAYHVTLLSGRLTARGYETVLAAGRVGPGEGSYAELAERYGASLHRIPALTPELRPLSDVRALVEVIRLIRSVRPDIVHTHTAKAGVIGRVAAVIAGGNAKVVHTYHGHVLEGYFGPVQTRAYRLAERLLGRASDRLVAVSRRLVDELVALRVAPAEKWAVIPLGLELDRFASSDRTDGDGFRADCGAAADDILFTYVGRLVPIKRIDVMLRAFAAADCPARLALVGDGPLRPALEALVADLGIGERVSFHGYRTDMVAVGAGTDVAILSSDNEGTPVWLIEAGASGRPLLATDVGGVRDVVGPDGGIVVPRRDEAALAAGVERLVRDGALRHDFGRAARKRAVQRFSADRLLDEIDRLYGELLGLPARAAA